MIEDPLLERVLLVGFLPADDAGKQSGDGLDQDQRGEFASGQDVVADRHLLRGQSVDHTFVDALVSAAQQREVCLAAELAHEVAIEAPAGRAQQQDTPPVVEGFHGGEQRLGFHHHAGPAAERLGVHGPMPILGEVSEIVDAQVDQPLGDRFAEQALAKRGLEQAGEDRDHVDTHEREATPRQR